MSKNPILLTLRFILELAMLAAYFYWGWTQHDGLLRILLAIGLPILAAALWGIFRVDHDPKAAPVAVPGIIRLILELGLFAGGVVALLAANQPTAAAILGVLVIISYVLSYDRVVWLIANRDGHAPL